MATRDEIYAALRKADAAGDADAVKALSAYLDKAPPAPATAKPKPKDTSAVSGFMAGVRKPIDTLAGWLGNIPGVHEAEAAINGPSNTTRDMVARHNADRANNTRTGYQALGNIAGTLPLSLVPGANTAAGVALAGGASGALLSDADTPTGVGIDAAKGVAGSVLGSAALKGAAALASGVKEPGLRALNAAGIPLTLGQIASAGKGVVSKAISKGEEALTSVWGLGDMINMARDRGTKGLNIALGNRILGNVGEKLPAGTEAGHDMVDAVQAKLSSRYQKLVPQLVGHADSQFNADLSAAEGLADQAGRKGQLVKVVSGLLKNRFNGAQISGQQLKDAESELTRLVGKYKNAQGDEGLYGDALDSARQALRGLVMRSNPDHAAELQGLNTSWAQLKQLRAASQSAGNNATGVATPATALRAFTKDGYRDKLLETAKQVLPNTTPDSGTARRAMATLGALGAGGATGAVALSPAIAAPVAASLLYTKGGQKVLNSVAFAQRPAAVSAAAIPLRNLSRYAPQIVATGTASRDK